MIELTNVCKTYTDCSGGIEVLKDINLKVAPGEFIAIMGPSGSGKSTLMNILGCLDHADSGTYRLDGCLTTELSDEEMALVRRDRIGFIFQSFFLLPKLTAIDNVALPLMYRGVPQARRREAAYAMLRRMGLAQRAHHRPDQLSGGQRQRVACARALINSPKLVLADEPTGNLDSRAGSEIMEILQNFSQSRVSVVLITHESEIARYADRQYILRDGRLQPSPSEGVRA